MLGNSITELVDGKLYDIRCCLFCDRCIIVIYKTPETAWSVVSVLLCFFDRVQQPIHPVFFYRAVDKSLPGDSSICFYYRTHRICVQTKVYT